MEALDHVVVLRVLSFAVSLGTWPGGAWVPGGFALAFAVGCAFMIQILLSNHAPGCLTCLTCTMGIAPIRESCTDFHFPSTDDELTGPGYMNQLACEQKKMAALFKSL